MSDNPADDFTTHARRRVWFIVLQAIIVVCVVVAVSAFRSETTASRTTHFVLHPNASVPPEQVPQAIDVLDGPLVQTVLRVLNSREILDRAADAADVDTDGITADATVSPSSAYFDVTVRGDDIDQVTAVSRSFTGAAAKYIEGTYGSYVLEPLGASSATESSFPPSAALLVTSALLGALVGLALVFLEWVARRAPFAAAASRTLSLLEPTRPNGAEPEKRAPGAAWATSGGRRCAHRDERRRDAGESPQPAPGRCRDLGAARTVSNFVTIRRSPRPRTSVGGPVALFGIACACTLVIGAGIALAAEPAHVALAGIVGLLALAGALVSLRGATVVAIFLLVTYSADAAPGTAGRLAVSGTIVVLLIATLVHAKLDAKPIEVPGDVRWIALYVATVAIATALAELGSGSSESLVDLVGYAVLAGFVCTLLDDAAWIRRGAWAIVSSFGVLAVLAIAQQLLHTYDATFAGLVKVEFDGDLIRSAGPLSANYFGQGLAAGAALAFYLALAARSARERAIAIGAVVACVVALLYTFSRGAIVAVIVAALLAAVLRRVRARTIVLVAMGTVVVALVALPPEVTGRVGDLASLGSPTSQEDPSVRGRTSENLAALEMWRAYPIAGVGPGNFEARYLDYSAGIGIDDRAEGRSAHSLYLEALAETGLLASLPFFALIFVTLRRPWQARSRLQGSDLLLAEGTLVALVAYLVAAATLHSAYPRYMWVFFGLALAAGRLRPVDAP